MVSYPALKGRCPDKSGLRNLFEASVTWDLLGSAVSARNFTHPPPHGRSNRLE